jgi:predicted Na+-dependent transporter
MERLEGFHTVLAKVALFAVALHFVLLVLNAALSRLLMRSADQRTAFVLCSSQKTLPAAILIWKSYFPATPLGPIVAVVYHLVQLVVDSILAPSFKKLPLVRK